MTKAVCNCVSSPDAQVGVVTKAVRTCVIDDLRKSRGLHSVSAYRHGLYYIQVHACGVAQSRHAFWGGTVSTWAR